MISTFNPPINTTDWEFFLHKLRDHLTDKLSVRPENLSSDELAALSRVMTNANTLQNNLLRASRYTGE